MVQKPNAYKENRKAAMTTIDQTAFNEMMIKQLNYMRMKGIDLTEELDSLVNWYLWICKKFPKPEEAVEADVSSQPVSEAPKKKKQTTNPPSAQAKAPKKKKTDK